MVRSRGAMPALLALTAPPRAMSTLPMLPHAFGIRSPQDSWIEAHGPQMTARVLPQLSTSVFPSQATPTREQNARSDSGKQLAVATICNRNLWLSNELHVHCPTGEPVIVMLLIKSKQSPDCTLTMIW